MFEKSGHPLPKIKLLIFCSLLAFNAKANDTLTRAQVYNFNVGDTFDYKYEAIQNIYYGYNVYTDVITFRRFIVVGIQNYPSQDSLVVIERAYQVFSNDSFSFLGNDTLYIDSNLNYAMFKYPNYEAWYLCTLTLDTNYNQRITNTAGWDCNNLGWDLDQVTYAEGLGIANIYINGGDGDGSWETYDTSLVYYSQAGKTWGTPSYILAGIANVKIANTAIQLSPNPATNLCHLQFIANGESYTASVFDISGREIMSLFNYQHISTFDFNVAGLSSGLYFVKVSNALGQVGVAKLVKE